MLCQMDTGINPPFTAAVYAQRQTGKSPAPSAALKEIKPDQPLTGPHHRLRGPLLLRIGLP